MRVNIVEKKFRVVLLRSLFCFDLEGQFFYPYSWLLRFKHVITDVVIQVENGVILGLVTVHVINCCHLP